MIESVTIKRTDNGERQDGIYIESGRRTEIVIVEDGQAYLTCIPGWDTTTDEGFHKAQFERRKRGFYRT